MRSKNNNKNELVKAILDTYQPETAEDVQNTLKDIFGPMFEAMLQGEMNYSNNSKEKKRKILIIVEMAILIKVLKQV